MASGLSVYVAVVHIPFEEVADVHGIEQVGRYLAVYLTGQHMAFPFSLPDQAFEKSPVFLIDAFDLTLRRRLAPGELGGKKVVKTTQRFLLR